MIPPIDGQAGLGSNPAMTEQPQDRKLRVGVLLSGGGRTLLNILDEARAGRLPVEVVIVIASRECK